MIEAKLTFVRMTSVRTSVDRQILFEKVRVQYVGVVGILEMFKSGDWVVGDQCGLAPEI